ncbi:MAG TPA: nuclear transport factor 2 family protein [Pyrinomonadaceae bacterium]|nr:nuclear transport factor 2 family protein [Pyrinomonadaceae bacterium]
MPTRADRGRAEGAVLRAESETMEAIGRKDAAALGRILDEEFVYRTPSGAELSREEFLQNVASLPVEILSVRGDGLRANVFGETAVITGVQRARVRDGDGQEAESVVAFTDVFVRGRGRWRLRLAYGVELPSQ